jgi:peptide/nickel transport system substrate-binding protein
MKMHRVRRSLLTAGLVLLAAMTSGYGCRHPHPDGETPGPLRVGFGIGKTARSASLGFLVDLLYAESLFKREWDGRLSPNLVSQWGWDDGGQRLWLELKQGVVFHDGTALTAELIARYLEQFLPGQGRNPRWGFAYVRTVRAVGSHRVALELTEPDFFLLAALSDTKIVHPANSRIATGPFRLTSQGSVVETVRFDQYHGGAPAFPGVRVMTYDTPRSAWAALMRGQVDVVQEVNRDSIEFMEGAARVQTYSSVQPFYIALVFNHRHPLLGNVEVRRAISQALDRDEIVRVGMRGRGRAALGPVWPFHWAYQESDESIPARDPVAARARLDAAGLRIRDLKDGRPPSFFKIRCLVYSEDPQYERIALLAQRQLHEIGVDMIIEPMTMEGITSRIAEGRFETYILPANASRTLERIYRSWHSLGPEGPAQLNTGYAGANDVLQRLRRSVNDGEIRASVAQLVEQFDTDVPAAFIAWMEVTRAVSGRVVVGDGADQDPFSNLRQWRPER